MYDLVIVGAGPAGAAAAIAALTARPDASVALLDRASFPRDKACGDAIGPHVVAMLRALGAGAVLDGYPALRWFELTARGRTVRWTLRGRTHTIPRTIFDHRLVQVARDRGAALIRRRVAHGAVQRSARPRGCWGQSAACG